MPDILVRGLDEQTLKRLKQLAKSHGRSLQGEAKTVLERAAGAGPEEIAAILEGWKKRFEGRKFSSGATMIRRDRKR